jgi:hypothetical protein
MREELGSAIVGGGGGGGGSRSKNAARHVYRADGD